MAEIQNVHLCAFPEELLIKILLDVELRDILAFKQTCRLFAELLENALELRYKVALGMAGLENGPPGNLSIAERLEKVKQYQDAWRNLNFVAGDPLPLYKQPNSHSGGVYSVLTAAGDIEFHQIGSPIRGRPEKHWTLTREAMGLLGSVRLLTVCGVDCSQDLLVLLNNSHISGVRNYAVLLLSATTSVRHSLASCPKLTLRHGNGTICHLSIYGDIIAAVTAQSQDNPHLSLWNWKSGIMIFDLQSTFGTITIPRCYAFVDGRHIMITGRSHLAVYSFDPEATSTSHPLLSRDAVCMLQLPPLNSPKNAPVNIQCSWSPVPCVMQTGISFQNDLANSVVMLEIQLGRGAAPRYYLCLSMSVVRSCVRQASSSVQTTSFAWEQWGPMGSRMITLSPALYRALGTLGSRCLFVRRDVNAREDFYLVAYEYYPWATRDMQAGVGQEARQPSSDGFQQLTSTDRIHTFMRYRVVVSPQKLPPDYQGFTLLSEDGFAFGCRSADNNDRYVVYLAPLCPIEQIPDVRARTDVISSK